MAEEHPGGCGLIEQCVSYCAEGILPKREAQPSDPCMSPPLAHHRCLGQPFTIRCIAPLLVCIVCIPRQASRVHNSFCHATVSHSGYDNSPICARGTWSDHPARSVSDWHWAVGSAVLWHVSARGRSQMILAHISSIAGPVCCWLRPCALVVPLSSSFACTKGT